MLGAKFLFSCEVAHDGKRQNQGPKRWRQKRTEQYRPPGSPDPCAFIAVAGKNRPPRRMNPPTQRFRMPFPCTGPRKPRCLLENPCMDARKPYIVPANPCMDPRKPYILPANPCMDARKPYILLENPCMDARKRQILLAFSCMDPGKPWILLAKPYILLAFLTAVLTLQNAVFGL